MIDQERLAELLLAWEERYEYGVDIPGDQLCRGEPELVADLEERIAALKMVQWLSSESLREDSIRD
jgi:hypothetical protein